MAIATLASILIKVRKLIGLPNPFQITDATLKDYINSFYSYDLPAQFRSLKLKDKLTFNTVRGLDTYPFDSEGFITIEQPVTCSKRPIALFEDSASFYQAEFNWQQQTNFSVGNGTTGPYTGFTTAKPLIRSVNNNPDLLTNPNYPASRVQNLLITANIALGQTLNVTDNGQIGPNNLIGNGSGTIDFDTGAITVTFTSAVPAGEVIQIQYNPVQLTIPLAILFFQNQFTLRPVPDRGYTIEMIAYRQPTQALMNTALDAGKPELSEWWELIAIGAAKKYYEDLTDFENIAVMDKLLAQKYALADTRTYAQLGKQRISTIFADQLSNSRGGSGPFGFGSGSV